MSDPTLFDDARDDAEIRREIERDMQKELHRPAFHGDTYEPALDEERLTTQLERVRAVMSGGRWHTLKEIRAFAGGSEAAVSARLRDLRKPKNGGLEVERRRIDAGLFEYRLVKP